MYCCCRSRESSERPIGLSHLQLPSEKEEKGIEIHVKVEFPRVLIPLFFHLDPFCRPLCYQKIELCSQNCVDEIGGIKCACAPSLFGFLVNALEGENKAMEPFGIVFLNPSSC